VATRSNVAAEARVVAGDDDVELTFGGGVSKRGESGAAFGGKLGAACRVGEFVARVDVKTLRNGESASIVELRVEAFDLVFVGGPAGVNGSARGFHGGDRSIVWRGDLWEGC